MSTSTTQQGTPETQTRQPDEDEINLLDLLIVLAKHKKVILGLPILAAVVAAGISLLLPTIYTASTRIMPPQQQQSSAAAMLGQLGALAGGAGVALGIKNPNELYVSMLQSRTVADALVERFKLKQRYRTESAELARRTLRGKTEIGSGKDGLITIEFSDADPSHAAELANAYVEELYKLTATMAVTEASQRRLFFEKQLQQAKDGLTAAELAFKKMQEQTGLIQLDAQGQATIAAAAQIRAQIASKEVELAAMRAFATEQNPDYQRVQQEIAGLRGQLAQVDRQGGTLFVPGSKVPEAGLEYARKMRDLKYYETIYELMAKQFEMAKFDESREASVVQVLDKAVPPEFKSAPKHSLIVILAALAAAFLGVLWAFIREAGEKARRNPEQAGRLQELKGYLRGF